MPGLDQVIRKPREHEVNGVAIGVDGKKAYNGSVEGDSRIDDNTTSCSLALPKVPGRLLSTEAHSKRGEEIDDPGAANFLHTGSAFRGPMDCSTGEWSASSSPKTTHRSRTGWLGGTDSDGFFRRWVEEPLGLATAVEHDEHSSQEVQTPRRGEIHQKPAGVLADPKSDFNSPHVDVSGPSKQLSGSVTWEFAARKLGLRVDSSRLRRQSTVETGDITQNQHEVEDGDVAPQSEEDVHQSPRTTSARLASRRWAMIKNRLVPGHANAATVCASSAMPHDVNISHELLTGGLATLMLKMQFERDEHGHRRVPVFLHHLKIRVSDSVHPISGTHTVFRIECQYANGAAKWVIYRELRDFVKLHTQYRVAKVYGRADIGLPEFPLTSLPYFKFLKSQNPSGSHRERRASFARLQRMHLENYLLALIRAVMFRPEANRLVRFFEISALSIALANSGGVQGKAGLLRVIGGETSRKGMNGGFSFMGLKDAAKTRWWNVRESYLVAVDDPGETALWDVFLLDSDFSIERPKRYYRMLDPTRIQDEDDYVTHSDSEDEEAAVAARQQLPDPNSIAIAPKPAGGIFKRIWCALHRPRSASNGKEDKGDKEGAGLREGIEVSPNGVAQPARNGQHTTLDQQWGEANVESRASVSQQLPSGKTAAKKKRMDVSQHTFYIQNSERRLRLMAKNERQLHQWITSLERMKDKTHWTKKNRFDSFAPIRLNVAAQWLVDGRDYFWNLSRAINLAKDRIYIHDWWLSPELQLRRPNKHNYRIDRLLERKAKQGVKIFVIVYKEVSSKTTPTDSNYTKRRLQSLHPNIMVQRSPSHFATGTFYWAHHEKLCVIDEAIAFMGGLDLCFGRWDTPQHALVDDPEDASQRVWPGKDYANERVVEFHALTKPDEDLHDRSKVPRMPWHDVGVQILGLPARDLCRHFVQRWNYLLRIKTHTRLMPFLLPPADFKPQELDDLGLTGSCEVQVCRSAGNWSMGLQRHVEHSIRNAYLKAIQMSERFVYIENQFFITSTVVNDVKIENEIGDALVSRIIKAHQERTPWRACILLPLLPGFTFPIDHSEASAVRMILECQNRTISRGPHSIFARLRKEGINPNDHITFFSLRTWGKLRGGVLATEQLYIHAKTMIVDDRLVIIGSANINERSQRGDRDSETAAVIRDTDMIDSTMGGRPFKVGRFAHTLRIRLMREHIGVDVDAMYNEDMMGNTPLRFPEDLRLSDPDRGVSDDGPTKTKGTADGRHFEHSVEDPLVQGKGIIKTIVSIMKTKPFFVTHGIDHNIALKVGLVYGNVDSSANDKTIDEGPHVNIRRGAEGEDFPGSKTSTFEEQILTECKSESPELPEQPIRKEARQQLGGLNGNDETQPEQPRLQELDGTRIDVQTTLETDNRSHAPSTDGGADAPGEDAIPGRKSPRQHQNVRTGRSPWTPPTSKPKIDPHGFKDPLIESFYKDVWMATALHNTEIFRRVFHCTPDDLVTTWKQYKEFHQHQERISKPVVKDSASATSRPEAARIPSETTTYQTPEDEKHPRTKNANGTSAERSSSSLAVNRDNRNRGSLQTAQSRDTLRPSTSIRSPTPADDELTPHRPSFESRGGMGRERAISTNSLKGINTTGNGLAPNGSIKPRRPTHVGEPLEARERDEMEALLRETCGHLVIYPTRFLEGEDNSNNFLFNADRLLPLPIYD